MAIDVILGVSTFLGFVLALASLVQARRARDAADAALRGVTRERLVTSLVRLESALRSLQWSLTYNAAPMFVALSHEWSNVASETRALLRVVGPERQDELRQTLVDVSTMVALAREEALADDEPAAGVMSDLAGRLEVALGEAIEMRVMIEQRTEMR